MEVKVDGKTLTFTREQRNCYERFLEEYEKGRKVLWCVLGLAGTGKTTLLKAILNAPSNELGGPKCLATAPVTLAAEELGARTIHSIFIKPVPRKPDSSEPVGIARMEEELGAVDQNAIDRMNKELRDVDVLLIDNINYVSDESFSWIDKRLREARDSEEPFGGISVICFGDLYQQGQFNENIHFYDHGAKSFELWRLFELFELTENYRFQSEEERIVLRTIATLSETPELTEEERTLINRAKEYLRTYCRMDGGSAQEVATKLQEMRGENEEGAKFAVIAPGNIMIADVLNCLGADTLAVVGPTPYPRKPGDVKVDFHNDPNFSSSDEKIIIVARGCSVKVTMNRNNTLPEEAEVVDSKDEIFSYGRYFARAISDRITRVKCKCGNDGCQRYLLLVVEDVYTYLLSQGLTFDGVIIVRKLAWDSRAHFLNEGQFYSAISRSKSLKNCRITPIDKKLTWTVQARATAEMRRLRAANNQADRP